MQRQFSLEQLEHRLLLTSGGPVILGGDDFTDHGSFGIGFIALPGTGMSVSESEPNDGFPPLPGTGNTVAETEPNDSTPQANAINIGDDFAGDINPTGDSDFVSFAAAAGQAIVATTVLNTLGDSTLTLFDTDGTTQLDVDDDGGPGLASQIQFTLQAAGTYFIAVEGLGSNLGTYTLELREVETLIQNDAMNIGDDFLGEINPDSDADFVSFSASADQSIVAAAVLGTLTLDSRRLTLFDTDGQSVLQDGFTKIEHTFDAAGTYYISVFSVESFGSSAGTYTLELREAEIPTEPVPLEGWRYIQRALENIAPQVTRSGVDGSVALLGSSDSIVETGNDAGAAYHYAVPVAAASTTALSGAVSFHDGPAAIQQFFTDLASGAVNPSIIVTAGTGAFFNDLESDEGVALTDNAFSIGNFVNSGGGLLSHGDDPDISYGWLSALLPGVVAPALFNETGLELTPEGTAAFPGLTSADINSGPFHNWFEPTSAFGDLQVLAIKPDRFDVDGKPISVIIGGASVVLPGSIVLTPDTDTHLIATSHTVTATVVGGMPPEPVADVPVTFEIVAGPNAGATGTCSPIDCTTDVNGQVTFTYVGTGGGGTDTIQGQIVDQAGNIQAAEAEHFWSGSLVAGIKFHDINQNGERDANEPVLQNWQIFADLNNNGLLDSGEPRGLTDEEGRYALGIPDPGTYTIRERLRPGWFQTLPAIGAGHIVTFAQEGDSSVDNNFGNALLPPGISGVVWNDLNGNGVVDAGEPGLGNVFVYVDIDNDGNFGVGEPSAVTAPDGTYHITGLSPGTYVIRQVMMPGWLPTFPRNGGPQTVIVPSGDQGVWASFGNIGALDFGDAPFLYPTRRDQDGARHGIVPGFHLGLGAPGVLMVDGEPNGQANAAALGDDLDLDGDDEDGVDWLGDTLVAGTDKTIRVYGSPAQDIVRGKLQAWIDFNADGDWSDAGEQIITDEIIATGSNLLTFSVPANAVGGPTYARFRISYDYGLSYDGLATEGEVED
ncbi:MAG: GEVED domain-containing protein, partial [Planctomycetota bacterium]|nr:GEVED domain-containing protein [Planctomycetota bacterium]